MHVQRWLMMVVLGGAAACTHAAPTTTPAPANAAERAATHVRPGITVLLDDSLGVVRGKRIALLTNQTGSRRARRVGHRGAARFARPRGRRAAGAAVLARARHSRHGGQRAPRERGRRAERAPGAFALHRDRDCAAGQLAHRSRRARLRPPGRGHSNVDLRRLADLRHARRGAAPPADHRPRPAQSDHRQPRRRAHARLRVGEPQ